MTRLCIRRILIGMALTFAPGPATGQMVVYDPSNYAQNVLQAARALQQINNQVTSLQNQTQMLLNQVKNLTSLPYSALQTIDESIVRTQQLLNQAQRIAYDINQIDQAQAVSPAIADYRPTDPQIAWYLARFIENVRSLPADPVIVRQNWLSAYDFITDKGAVALNDYARASDPFAKVGKIQVAVDISNVIRASSDSFRVAWIERRSENASLAATERWTAILTVAFDTPHDAERLRKNPLGVFVHAINWSKELG